VGLEVTISKKARKNQENLVEEEKEKEKEKDKDKEKEKESKNEKEKEKAYLENSIYFKVTFGSKFDLVVSQLNSKWDKVIKFETSKEKLRIKCEKYPISFLAEQCIRNMNK